MPKASRIELPAELSATIDAVVGSTGSQERLLDYLLAIRDRFGGVTDAVLARVAERLKLSHAELYEVATFYPAIRYAPDSVDRSAARCDDLVCALLRAQRHVSGEPRAAEAGSSCRSGTCNGFCDRASQPDGNGPACAGPPAQIRWRRLAPYRDIGGYLAVERVVEGVVAGDDILSALADTILPGGPSRGLQIANRWRLIRERGGMGTVIVNADEGELATFKDRYILERDPHGVLDGAVMAALVTGATRLIVYLRDEYDHLLGAINDALAELRDSGLCSNVQLECRRAGGAYICGEETALIASLEGRVARPRERISREFALELNGKPALIHNVETFYRLRSAWMADVTAGLPVTTLLEPDAIAFSVSGRVVRPGCYILRLPKNLRAVVQAAGGFSGEGGFGGVVVGGSAGRIVPAALSDLPIDALRERGISLGSGSVVVFSGDDDMRWIASGMAAFLARESCGQCTPCRVGTRKMSDLLAGGVFNADLAKDLAMAMKEASICGLGRGAGGLLNHVTELFREAGQ